jgi:hypothetical protein
VQVAAEMMETAVTAVAVGVVVVDWHLPTRCL